MRNIHPFSPFITHLKVVILVGDERRQGRAETTKYSDGTKSTIYNSNPEGGSYFVQKPNAIKNGFDDGFGISADAETGEANWMVAYQSSTKDAQTVGVTMRHFVVDSAQTEVPTVGNQNHDENNGRDLRGRTRCRIWTSLQVGTTRRRCRACGTETSGKLRGILFFQDPLTSHPHQCDIECLVRQAVMHNTLMANTPVMVTACMEVFKTALMGVGRPELIPSFSFDLQCPTV
jgi:hypothetical protein